MRTFEFKTYQDRPFSKMKFLPSQTFESDHFGRHFFIDSSFEFLSAPSFVDGGYDESQLDYVSNWTDLEGVNLSKLFGICLLYTSPSPRDRTRSRMPSSA